jgi:hypothetical protein
MTSLDQPDLSVHYRFSLKADQSAGGALRVGPLASLRVTYERVFGDLHDR